MNNEILNTGVVFDPRSEEDKQKDWTHEEIAEATLPTWVEDKNPLKFYETRDQDGSLTCGAQSAARSLLIEEYKETGKITHFSALPIYQKRTNAPQGGMYMKDVLELCCKQGSTLEGAHPSQRIGETKSNERVVLSDEDKEIMETYRAGGYVNLPKNIDTVASILDQGKGVSLIIFFKGEEWNSTLAIKDQNLSLDNSLHHYVVATDYTLINGVKHLVIEDSANIPTSINGTGQRLMTEEFFNKRVYGLGYLLDRPNPSNQPERPFHVFTRPLYFGMRNDPDVKVLQDILKYEGDMNNSIPSTGNYLQMTANALLKWQIRNNVAPVSELKSLEGKVFGPKTRIIINKKYSIK